MRKNRYRAKIEKLQKEKKPLFASAYFLLLIYCIFLCLFVWCNTALGLRRYANKIISYHTKSDKKWKVKNKKRNPTKNGKLREEKHKGKKNNLKKGVSYSYTFLPVATFCLSSYSYDFHWQNIPWFKGSLSSLLSQHKTGKANFLYNYTKCPFKPSIQHIYSLTHYLPSQSISDVFTDFSWRYYKQPRSQISWLGS